MLKHQLVLVLYGQAYSIQGVSLIEQWYIHTFFSSWHHLILTTVTPATIQLSAKSNSGIGILPTHMLIFRLACIANSVRLHRLKLVRLKRDASYPVSLSISSLKMLNSLLNTALEKSLYPSEMSSESIEDTSKDAL